MTTYSYTALVVGAAGFIGKYLVARLLRDNARVFALCRNIDDQADQLRHWLMQKGIDHQQLIFIKGDVTLFDLGLLSQDWESLRDVKYLYNTSALFKWNLTMEQAREVNVNGLTNLLSTINKYCHIERAVHLSGYMLTLKNHLQEVGVYRENVEKTDWSKVYKTLGAYEASKIEGHFNWIKQADLLGIPWTVIHPATVIGDEVTGEIPNNQPIASLIRQLKQKKMRALPGSSSHSLPLVSVNMLIEAILYAAKEAKALRLELLVADPHQLTFKSLVDVIAQSLEISPPHRFISISLLKCIFKWKWLAEKLETSPEMLNFIRTEQLDLTLYNELNKYWEIPPSKLLKTIQQTVEWVSKQPTKDNQSV